MPKSGVDVGDHPPITPTANVPKSLSGIERGLYEYVVRMFLATHSQDCKYEHSSLRIRAPNTNQIFKLSGNRLIEPGFTAIASWLAVKEDAFDIANYVDHNKKVIVQNIDYKAGQT